MLFEYYTSNDDDNKDVYGTKWRAQTFTLGNVGLDATTTITGISIKAWRSGFGSPGTVTAVITSTDGSGLPTGSDLSTGTYNGNNFSFISPGGWYDFTMSAATLEADAKYALILKATSGSAANYVNWRDDKSSPSYSGGNMCVSTNSGTSWTSETTADAMFKIYGKGKHTEVYDSYTSNDDDGYLFDTFRKYGQSFTTSFTTRLTRVRLKLLTTSSGDPGTITATLYDTDGSGLPTGSALTSGTSMGTNLTSTAVWKAIDLTPYTLKADTKYALTLSAQNTGYLKWRGDKTLPSYSGGNQLTWFIATWSNATNVDMMFELCGDYTQNESVTLYDNISFRFSRLDINNNLSLSDTVTGMRPLNATELVELIDNIQLSKNLNYNGGETFSLDDKVVATKPAYIEIIELFDICSTNKLSSRLFSEETALSDDLTFTLNRTYRDSCAATDDEINGLNRGFQDLTTLNDTFVYSISRIIRESIALVDGRQDIITAGFNEYPTLTDTLSRTFLPKRACNESTALNDVLTTVISKNYQEATTLNDLVTAVKLVYTETLTLYDSRTNKLSCIFAEATTLSDGLIKTQTRIFGDVATLTDSVVLNLSRTLKDSFDLTDGEYGILTYWFEDYIACYSILGRKVTFSRLLSDIINVTDVKTQYEVRSLYESCTLSDDLTLYIQRAYIEQTSTSDAVIKSIRHIFNDSLTATDEEYSAPSGIFCDQLTPSDLIARNVLFTRTFSEQTSPADSLARSLRRQCIEFISLADNVARSFTKILTLTESVSLYDVKIHKINFILSDIPLLSDTYSKIWNNTKQLIESVACADVLSRKSVSTRILYENIVPTDEEYGAPAGNLYDKLTLNDLTTRTALLLRIFTEQIASYDSLIRALARQYYENVVVADNVTRLFTKVLKSDENIVLSDILSKMTLFSLFESLVLYDLFGKLLQKITTESIVLSDQLVKSVARVHGDCVVLSDGEIYKADLIFNEAHLLDDVYTKIWHTTKNLADNVGCIDVLNLKLNINRAPIESIQLSDLFLRSLAKLGLFNESISLICSAYLASAPVFAESISTYDIIVKALQKSVYELFILADTVTKSLAVPFEDGILVTDGKINVYDKWLYENVTLTDYRHIGGMIYPIELYDDFKLYYRLDVIKPGGILLFDEFGLQTVWNFARYFYEGISLDDSCIAVLHGTMRIDNSAILYDEFMRIWVTSAVFNEVCGLTDAFYTGTHRPIAFEDILTLHDYIKPIIGHVSTEAVVLTDTLVKQISYILEDQLYPLDERVAKIEYILKDYTELFGAYQHAWIHLHLFVDDLSLTDLMSILKVQLRMLPEVVLVSDIFTRNLTLLRLFTDQTTLADIFNVKFDSTRKLQDYITLTESLMRTVERPFIELTTLNDKIVRKHSRTFEDQLYPFDERVTKIEYILKEYTQLFDEYRRAWASLRIYTDVLSITDIISILKVQLIALYDVTTLYDSLSRGLTKYLTLFDSSSLSDVFSRLVRYVRTLQDSTTLNDLLAPAVSRPIVDVTTLSDILTKYTKRAFEDQIYPLDERVTQIDYILKEYTQLLDAYKHTWASLRVYVDNLSIIDVISTIKIQLITLHDVTTLYDTLSRGLIKYFTLLDSTSLSDIFDRVIRHIRILQDNITIYDTLVPAISRPIADVTTLNDVLIKYTKRTFEDQLYPVDERVSKVAYILKDYTELLDQYNRIWTHLHSLTDAVLIADSFTTLSKSFATFFETVALTDIVALKQTLLRAFDGQLTLLDVLDLVTVGIRQLYEGIVPYDELTFSLERTFKDTTALDDAMVWHWSRVFEDQIYPLDERVSKVSCILKEYVEILDNYGRVWSHGHLLVDVVTLDDVVDAILYCASTYIESIQLIDEIALRKTFTRGLMEQLTLVDMFSTSAANIHDLYDDTSLYDQMLVVKRFKRDLNDDLGVVDILSFTRALSRVYSDLIALYEELTAELVVVEENVAELFDGVTVIFGKIFTDNLAMYDNLDVIPGLLLWEIIEPTDSITRALTRLFEDVTIITTSVAPNAGYIKSFTDSFALYDAIAPFKTATQWFRIYPTFTRIGSNDITFGRIGDIVCATTRIGSNEIKYS